MDNDFIKGMETLIRCKQYVENRLDWLYKARNNPHFGNFDKEIARCEYALGYRETSNIEEK